MVDFDLREAVRDRTGASAPPFLVANAFEGQFALLASSDAMAIGGLVFATPSSPAYQQIQAPGSAGSATFLARGNGEHLLATEQVDSGRFMLSIQRAAPQLQEAALDGAACATGPTFADAVANGGGYLVALASGRPFGSCLNQGADGPATEIQLARYGSGLLVAGATLAGDDPVGALQLASRSDGAWLVWQRVGSSAAAGAVQAARIDASAMLVSSPINVAAPGDAVNPASARLGDRLAVGWIANDSDAPRIVVRLFDASSDRPIAEQTLVRISSHTSGTVAMLGSADATQLIVTWTELPVDGSLRRVELARLGWSCSLPP